MLDTIGTAATPVLLLIGEENKHHGVLEVLRETIEVFPGIFDDTADMMRHGKARYAVEKGDDGLKYRILDFDVAPPPALQERPVLSCLVLSINLIHCGNEFRNSVPVRTLGL